MIKSGCGAVRVQWRGAPAVTQHAPLFIKINTAASRFFNLEFNASSRADGTFKYFRPTFQFRSRGRACADARTHE